MINLIVFRQKYFNWGIVFIGISLLTGCVGSPVASYKTETQKFSWGEMYAWMSKAQGGRSDDTKGFGYLLLNFSFKGSVMEKGCVLTVKRVYLKDADTEAILIDNIASFENETPMIAKIGEYNRGQLSLSKYPFEYAQSSFPYDLRINIGFNCKNKQTPLTFSKQIEFRMVQPTLWEQ